MSVHLGHGVTGSYRSFWTDGGTCTVFDLDTDLGPVEAPVEAPQLYRIRQTPVRGGAGSLYVEIPPRWSGLESLCADLAAFAAWWPRAAKAVRDTYEAGLEANRVWHGHASGWAEGHNEPRPTEEDVRRANAHHVACMAVERAIKAEGEAAGPPLCNKPVAG